MHQLENAQQAALEKSDVMLSTRDELESTKVRVEAISLQLQQCQKDVSPDQNSFTFHQSCSRYRTTMTTLSLVPLI